MHTIGLIVGAAALLTLGTLPARARPTPSEFTVVATITPAPVANGATATLKVHTRIGSECTASVIYRDGSGLALTPPRQHVGQTGIVSWRWIVRTAASSGVAVASCTWKNLGRAGSAHIAIRGRRDLPPAYRPKPIRPGVAVLGATEAAWVAMFGPPMRLADAHRRSWQACFDGAGTPRITALFRDGRAYRVEGAFCTSGPADRAARLKEAQQYFPPDTASLGTWAKSDGGGTDWEYLAPSLAFAFAPGDFLGCGTARTRPGTFSLSLDAASGAAWTVELGTCT